jgi:4-hydroxymandelate synthase
MSVLDIEYAELYVGDRNAALEHFVDHLGFTPVASGERPGLSTVLVRQNGITLLVSSGPAAAPFLDKHGDGVADLAFACTDPRRVHAAALAHGARAIESADGPPAVSGFGDVRHTLLPAPPPDRTPRLPPGRDWTPLARDERHEPGPVVALDHVAVLLEAGTLEESTDRYARAFGLARYSSEYVAFGEQAMDSIVVRDESGRVTFTLIEPDKKKQAGQIDAFLDRNNGPGVQHLAFRVEQIVPAVHGLEARGVEFLQTVGAYYDMLAERFPDLAGEIADLRGANVLADRDEWGYLLQLFTRSPYPRNTLFYELVQRRGSRGFGARNIRALYEAVERDREARG